MRSRYVWCWSFMLLMLISCKKNPVNTPDPIPTPPTFLLKDISISTQPPPLYAFVYDANKRITQANFAAGVTQYLVSYNGNRISEIRNSTIANKDRLQYTYDDAGLVSVIKYFSEDGTQFRRCFISFNGRKLEKMEWERKASAGGFEAERTLTLEYLPDGNLWKTTDHYLPLVDQPESTFLTEYSEYDNKINADAFSIIHSFSDHLILLPDIIIQKNNPGKMIRTGTGLNYIMTFTHTYNDRGLPTTRVRDGIITKGSNTGSTFQTTMTYNYVD